MSPLGEVSALPERIRRVGLALGLDAVGFAPAAPNDRTRFQKEWIERGYAGEIHYIERRLEERMDPRKVLPDAESIIVVGLALPAPSPEASSEGPARVRVARYAGGDDYHDVLLDRVRALEAALPSLAQAPPEAIRSRSYVDTGPVAERAAAAAGGLGWIGKNSCLIHPDLGSHLMLGVILTTLDIAKDEAEPDHCGTCRACLDVCPTNAFPEPYVLDATRCLSYSTIELSDTIPAPLRAAQGDHVFGCDLCQTVCPWNKSRPKNPLPDPLGLRSRLAPREEWIAPTLSWILGLTEAEFADAARGTALKRAGYRGLIRNALISAGNAKDPSLRPVIEGYAQGEDPLLAEHARWALERLA
ncbi:MAG: tRNA epoxyqueuosine(34) reductase QueG [Myxococcota bacterium]